MRRCHIDQLRGQWSPRAQLHTADNRPHYPDKSLITDGPIATDPGDEARGATRSEDDLPGSWDCVPVMQAVGDKEKPPTAIHGMSSVILPSPASAESL